jgi:hypothetical protein
MHQTVTQVTDGSFGVMVCTVSTKPSLEPSAGVSESAKPRCWVAHQMLLFPIRYTEPINYSLCQVQPVPDTELDSALLA